jgi:putative flippase GtrA
MSRQFLLFCVAGVLGLVVDTAVLYAAAPWLGWYGARLLSFWCAASTTWAFNRRFTFVTPLTESQEAAESPSQELAQYLRYLASMLLGGAVNYAIYVATLKGVGLNANTAWMGLELSPWLGMIGVALGSVGGLLFNFVSARYFVFASPAPNNTESDPE